MSQATKSAEHPETRESSQGSRYARIAADERLGACEAIGAIVKEYSRERPEVVALWTFGIGFVLGWKLKPW
jgi:hypothetical protein